MKMKIVVTLIVRTEMVTLEFEITITVVYLKNVLKNASSWIFF